MTTSATNARTGKDFTRIILLLALLYAAPTSMRAATAPSSAVFNCLGAPSQVQSLRDQLEMTVAYLRKSQDNFGPGRGVAIASTERAIAQFEHLYGNPALAPTPGSGKTHLLGRHGHPHMQWAAAQLRSLRSELQSTECMKVGELDGLRKDIAEAIDAIAQAFVFNPPFSGK